MQLDELLSSPVDPTTKGWPAAPALPLREVGRQGWNLLRGDLPLPVALIKASALSHNSRWMRSFLEHFGVAICPHGKTTMAPQLFARQLADGAWGITVATVQQLRVCRRFGVQRVVMANQLVGGQAIREVLAELRADPAFWFACLVDSVELVDELASQARSFGHEQPLQVLLEGGYPGGRTGCRTVEQALAVARATAAAPELALIGIEGFEGLIARPTPAETAAVVDAFLATLVEIAQACAKEDLFAPGKILLSAGGSAFFDQVARAFHAAGLERAVEVMLRSGCYFTHDSKMYRQFFASHAQSSNLRSITSGPASRPRWSFGRTCSRPRSPASRSRRSASAMCPSTSICRCPSNGSGPASTSGRRRSAPASRSPGSTISTPTSRCRTTVRCGSATC